MEILSVENFTKVNLVNNWQVTGAITCKKGKVNFDSLIQLDCVDLHPEKKVFKTKFSTIWNILNNRVPESEFLLADELLINKALNWTAAASVSKWTQKGLVIHFKWIFASGVDPFGFD